MSPCISLRLAIAAIFAAAVLPLTALAQSQDSPAPSVADAARRAREQKKAAAKQPAPVITDDTLKPAAPAQSPEAAAPAPPPAPAAQPAADSSGAPDASAAPAGQPASAANAGDTDQKTKDSPELAKLKQQVAEAQKDLELLQRELALQQDTYFSNPDHSHDLAGKAKLEAMLEQIPDKQQAVDALKTQLAALQASSGTTAPAAPNAPPQP